MTNSNKTNYNKPKKQRRPKSNLIKISEVIPAVKENMGIKKQLKINALKEIWPLITGFEIAGKSQPAYFDNNNNLVIRVKSGVLVTELSMQKISIFQRLKDAIKNTDISFNDIRFINRP